ncbi:hypothetical protein [Yersinia similis]|uniref:hypothetical protein n=1 Tax=Yersinia similis TaxID=367190 RepID=UPI0011A94F95|nr:hypothetical protein [Yersinia similis]
MEIKIADYPQIKSCAHYLRDDAVFDGYEALAFYERNWRYIDTNSLEPHEKALIDTLISEYGNGILNV